MLYKHKYEIKYEPGYSPAYRHVNILTEFADTEPSYEAAVSESPEEAGPDLICLGGTNLLLLCNFRLFL